MNKFWKAYNQTKNSKTSGEILIYGDIGSYEGWNDVTAKQFNTDLKALGEVDEIAVRINSVGGEVFAAQAIYSMLKAHRATINVYIDGLAASAASVIAMAGDTITMPKNTMMMIHNPLSICHGFASDMRECANLLDKIGETIIATYEEKTKKSKEDIKALMDAETWFTAEEAVEMGFADVLDEDNSVAASLQDNGVYAINGQNFDVTKFKNAQKLYKSTANTPTPKAKKEAKVMNLDEFKAQYPDLYTQVYNSGAEAERARLQGLDGIATAGCEEIVNKAKYETMASVEKTAIEVLNHIKANPTAPANRAITNLVADAAVVNTVSSTDSVDAKAVAEAQEEEKRKEIVANMIAAANRK